MKKLITTFLLLLTINSQAKDFSAFYDVGKSFGQLSSGVKLVYKDILLGYSFGGDISILSDKNTDINENIYYTKKGINITENRSYKIGYDLLDSKTSNSFALVSYDTQQSSTSYKDSNNVDNLSFSKIGAEIAYSAYFDSKIPIKYIGSMGTSGNAYLGIGFSF